MNGSAQTTIKTRELPTPDFGILLLRFSRHLRSELHPEVCSISASSKRLLSVSDFRIIFIVFVKSFQRIVLILTL